MVGKTVFKFRTPKKTNQMALKGMPHLFLLQELKRAECF